MKVRRVLAVRLFWTVEVVLDCELLSLWRQEAQSVAWLFLARRAPFPRRDGGSPLYLFSANEGRKWTYIPDSWTGTHRGR